MSYCSLLRCWRVAHRWSVVLIAMVMVGFSYDARLIAGQAQTGQAQSDQVGTSARRPRVAPPRDSAARNMGTGRIRGRVIAGDTGLPVRQAQVEVSSREFRAKESVTTDDDGQYELTGLPAGQYQIHAIKDGFVSTPYSDGRRVALEEGATAEGIELRLRRGGVITGTVVDEFGVPVPGARVTPLRSRFAGGQRQFSPARGSTVSDDRGEFRLFALTPGRYYLLASPPKARNRLANTAVAAEASNANAMAGPRLNALIDAPTYHPGTLNAAEAQPVSVADAGMASVTISLMRARPATITGRVEGWQTGMRGGVAVRAVTGSALSMITSINADGAFVVKGLTPGLYQLRAQHAGRNAEGPPRIWAGSVLLDGADVADVTLELQKKIRVTGRLRVTSAVQQSLKPSAIQVVATPADTANHLSPLPPGTVKSDLSFELETWPGRGFVRMVSGMNGLSLKAVRLNGADVSDSGIEFVNDQDVTGLELELTDRPAVVEGTVTSKGEPSSAYTVVLFPQDRERWSEGAGRYLALGRSDSEGRFTVRSLPAGDYYAVALSEIEQYDWRDPAFLEGIRPMASRVSLVDGGSRTIRLELASSR